MTTALTTRITAGTGATVKNLPLSSTEIDNNFLSLNDNKIETSEAVTTNTAGKVVKREDGKVMKPEGWTPPDLSKFVGE